MRKRTLLLLVIILFTSIISYAHNENFTYCIYTNSPPIPSPKIACSGSVAATVLPFTEDWESYSGILNGDGDIYCGTNHKWEFETSSIDGRAMYGTDAHQTNGGSGALTLAKLSDNVTYDTNFAILTLNLAAYSASLDLELRFDYVDHIDENHAHDKVWIRGSNSDEWIEAYDLDPINTADNIYQSVNSIDIDNLLSTASPAQTPSATFQVRFGQEDNHSVNHDGISFDNIIILEEPCTKPSSLSANSITINSAILTWAENGTSSNWDIEYGSKYFSQGSGTMITNTSSKPYSLTGLSLNSTYDFYVRANCGGGSTSYWAGPYTFKTNYNTLTPATLPFDEDWENNNGSQQNEGNIYCGGSYNWSLETSTDDGLATWGTNAHQNNGGSGALTITKFSYNDTENINYAILTLNLSNYTTNSFLELSFDYADHGDENNTNDKVWIRGSSSDSWVLAYNLLPASLADNTFKSVNSIDIDNILSSASQTVSASFQVKFGQEDDHSITADGITYDNINIQVNNCTTPTDLSANSITQNSAILNWTELSVSTQWGIEYGVTGFTQGAGTTITNTSSKPYTLSGLNTNTTYDYYVRANCGGGSNSYWEGPYTFTTSCNAITPATLPFDEDWESYNGTQQDNGNIHCGNTYNWTFESSTDDGLATWGTNAHQTNGGSGALTMVKLSPDYAMNINAAILTLDLSGYTSNTFLELSFDYADNGNENYSNNKVWIRGNSSDAWVLAYNLIPESLTNNTFKSVNSIDIDNILSIDSQTVSSSFQLKLGQEDNYNISADGITYDNIIIKENSCLTPTNLSANTITQNSAILTWTESNISTHWDIEYGAMGFSQGSGTMITNTSSNPYTLTGLSSNSSTDFYVRANCGSGSTSYWEGPYTFTTLCNLITPATLPFNEDWESYNGSQQDVGNIYCGGNYNWTFETSTDDGLATWGTNAHQTNGGSGALTLTKFSYNNTLNTNAAILTIDLSNYTANTFLELSFDYADHGDENNTNDKVWIRGNSSKPWVLAYNLLPQGLADNTFKSVNSIDIDNILSSALQTVSASFQVKFGQEDDHSITADGITYDNINIQVNSCLIPTELTASGISHNSAILNWTENGGTGNWDIEYGATGFIQGAGTTITNTASKPYTLSSLSSNTTYDYYVRANCGGGSTSYWAGPYTFFTDCDTLSAVNLPFKEGWENNNGSFIGSGNIICDNDHSWKLESDEELGRARYGTNAYQVNSGNGAITLDKSTDGGANITNYLTLTLNLSNYTTSNILQLEFDFTDHQDEEHGQEMVWIRGSSTDAWILVKDLNPATATDNVFQTVEGIDIDNILSNASQTVSSTFQVRFGQQDNYTTLHDGITFDNIHIKLDNEAFCSGKTTKCSPRYSRTGSSDYFYDKFELTVPSNGNYDIHADWQGFNGYLYLYQNSFDADAPTTNLITSDDDYGSTAASRIENIALSTGTTYIVVATANSAISSGSSALGNMEFTITGTSDQANCNSVTDINGEAQSVVNSVPSTDGTTRLADYECMDKLNWTHYYDDNATANNYSDDKILISINKNNNDIGSIGDPSFEVKLAGNAGVSPITDETATYVNYDWYVYNRYWNLTPSSQPNTDVSVRYYYTTVDFTELQSAITNSGGDSPASVNKTVVFKINSLSATYDVNPANGHIAVPVATAYNTNGFWQYKNAATASTANWESGTYDNEHYAEYIISSFSGGGGGASGEAESDGSPLPISLVEFYGETLESSNILYWTTASEENTDYFEIERAEDPSKEFIFIGKTTAAGNSNNLLNYKLEDFYPIQNAYYRLKSVDFDGSTMYSNIIYLGKSLPSLEIVNAFPIPTKNTTEILISIPESGDYKISTVDINGSILKSETIYITEGMNTLKLDLSTYSAGSYYCIIENGDSRSFVKVVKE